MSVELPRKRGRADAPPDRERLADAAVIELLGSGVAEAFLAKLAARFGDTPYGDVEDALFEAIADAWRRMQTKPIADLKPYVYRAAFYLLSRNARRRQKLTSLVEPADGPLGRDRDQR